MTTIDAITIADPPDAWADAGFTVDDDGVCRVGSVRIELAGAEAGKRIVSWSLRGIDPATTEIDGLPTTASTREPCTGAQHPNGVEIIDHLVILSPHTDRTVAVLNGIGLPTRRTRHVDAEQYGFAARQTFFKMAEVVLELIGSDEPMGDGPAGFFGLAYTVSDIDALAGRYGEHIGSVKDAVQPGRRITTLRHKELGMSVATAFMSAGPDSIASLETQAG
jgi:hypothetical protein